MIASTAVDDVPGKCVLFNSPDQLKGRAREFRDGYSVANRTSRDTKKYLAFVVWCKDGPAYQPSYNFVFNISYEQLRTRTVLPKIPPYTLHAQRISPCICTVCIKGRRLRGRRGEVTWEVSRERLRESTLNIRWLDRHV